MVTDRCPSCHAAVADSADWCSLCFTRLGAADETAAAPPVEAVPAELVLATAGLLPPATRSGAATPPGAATSTVAATPPAAATPAPAPADPLAPATGSAPATAGQGWPCHYCGTVVAFDSDLCPECGSAFLADDIAQIGLQVPGVGDLARAGQSTRLVVGLAAAAVLTGGLFLLLLLLGTFL